MAITTLDQALAGMKPAQYFAKSATPALVAGRPHSLWYLAGTQGVGATPPTTTAGGTALSGTAAQILGQIFHQDPVSGNAYLARLQAIATIPGTLLLCDRLLHDSSLSTATAILNTVTTAQTINTAALPARDNAGTVNGDGVQWGIEVVTATGAGVPTLTMSYTNQAGVAAHTATNIDPTVATSAVGAFYRMGLQAGDTGGRSVQTLTLSATWTSGQVALVAYRVLAALELPGNNIPNAIDALTSGFPQLYNGVVPFFIFIPSTTTATNISGTYTETQG